MFLYFWGLISLGSPRSFTKFVCQLTWQRVIGFHWEFTYPLLGYVKLSTNTVLPHQLPCWLVNKFDKISSIKNIFNSFLLIGFFTINRWLHVYKCTKKVMSTCNPGKELHKIEIQVSCLVVTWMQNVANVYGWKGIE